MSDTPDILHEEDVRVVIQDEIINGLFATHAAAPDVVDSSVTLNATFSHTEVEQAINNVAGVLNTIIGVLRDNGLLSEPS